MYTQMLYQTFMFKSFILIKAFSMLNVTYIKYTETQLPILCECYAVDYININVHKIIYVYLKLYLLGDLHTLYILYLVHSDLLPICAFTMTLTIIKFHNISLIYLLIRLQFV